MDPAATNTNGPSAPSAADAAASPSPWGEGAKHPFVLDGCDAYVVVPAVAAPGKPWVWRTSWPDHHAEVDLEVLHHGYHVAYLDVVDMLGCDASLDLMDRFYALVRTRWGLAERMALEPCSRGGLHAYRYAARHPGRAACIYGDTPVMDFKSWPRRHAASRESWALILRHYGFADEQAALAYRGNPLDLLEPLARARIPLRHAISLNDRVVPAEENTLEAQRRLRRLGHDIEVVAVPEGNACEGHHFPLPEVYESSRFIMRHAGTRPGGKEYFRLRGGLANCRARFAGEKAGRVVFLGGSITHNPGWRDEVMRDLQGRFPGTAFDFVAAGVPSLGSVAHAFRLERDVLARGPVDLLFVEAAVNDHNHDGLPNCAELALRGMEGVVRHVRAANPMTDVVEMHFAHPGHLADRAAGRTPYTVAAHERVAEHYGCASLDLSLEVAERIAAGEFTWEGDFRDVHPSPYGQRVYAGSIIRLLDAAFAEARPPRAHACPPTIDHASFARGRLGRLEDAVCGPGFALDPCWHPTDGATRPGFVDVPALVASAPGAELAYGFEGDAIGIFAAAGPGTGAFEFSVDGRPFERRETFTAWSGQLHLPWPLILADGLGPGAHQLALRSAADAEGRAALRIIHILVNGRGP